MTFYLKKNLSSTSAMLQKHPLCMERPRTFFALLFLVHMHKKGVHYLDKLMKLKINQPW